MKPAKLQLATSASDQVRAGADGHWIGVVRRAVAHKHVSSLVAHVSSFKADGWRQLVLDGSIPGIHGWQHLFGGPNSRIDDAFGSAQR